PALRHRHAQVAEAEVAELEGAPVQVGVELLADDDNLGRGSGIGLVLELDGVGQRLLRGEEASGADDVVGVNGPKDRNYYTATLLVPERRQRLPWIDPGIIGYGRPWEWKGVSRLWLPLGLWRRLGLSRRRRGRLQWVTVPSMILLLAPRASLSI